MPTLARLIGATVSASLLVATPVRAGEGDITPDSANSARFGVEQQGKQLIDSGAFAEAAELYWTEGIRLKDPVLIIDSAEAMRDRAAAERSIEVAQQAIERIAPALDMLHYLRDSSTSVAWQPVAPEHLDTVIRRAEALVADAQTLIATIEDEQRKAAEASAAVETSDQPKRGPAKPGTGLIAAGSASLVVGLGGAGLGVAGLVLGAQAQARVEDPLVYQREHRIAEAQGHNANVLAGVGLALAGVGVGVGVALIAVGVKKRKHASSHAQVVDGTALVPIWLGPEQGAGIGLVGRF